MTSLSDLDPFDPKTIENPFSFFSALRKEAPVYLLPNQAYYLVSRYEDVMKAVMDVETFSSNLVAVLLSGSDGDAMQMLDLYEGDAQESEGQTNTEEGPKAVDVLAIADPPKHSGQRRVCNRAFSMRRVQAMESYIRGLAEKLIEPFTRGESCDWVNELAVPLPMKIIIDLLGLPESDMSLMKEYSDASVSLLSGINTEQGLLESGLKVNEMIHYLDKQYQKACDAPGDNVLGDLIRAAEQDEENFSRNEIVSMLIQLLTAGNETTRSLIASSMRRLLQEEALQDELRQSPEKIDNFVEEMLRLESPFYGHFRVVKKDTELGGVKLAAGSRVMLLWASANRDEEQFQQAQDINLDRDKPRSHLAFGYGIHHCIGAELARLEAKIALETILQKSQHIALAEDNDFTHVPSLFVRSLKALNIRVSC